MADNNKTITNNTQIRLLDFLGVGGGVRTAGGTEAGAVGTEIGGLVFIGLLVFICPFSIIYINTLLR